VLEDARRGRDRGSGQTFYAGIAKPRELAHDAHLYRAYTKAADRLVGQGAHIRRVVLEEALKRDYQQFLHASNAAWRAAHPKSYEPRRLVRTQHLSRLVSARAHSQPSGRPPDRPAAVPAGT
jgi:hypothetical protein